MLETDLSQPVSLWLTSLGFTPYAEIPFPHYCPRTIDIIARKDSELIAVELKRTLTKDVIHQTYLCDLITPRRYAAVATVPRAAGIERCAQLGVGLLSVINGCVTVILEPKERPNIDHSENHYPAAIHKALDQMIPNGLAGRPCRKGEGPAQDCYDRVADYRLQHPTASWKQIFGALTTHYNDHRSLASSMRIVQKTRAKRGPKESPPQQQILAPQSSIMVA